MITSKSLAEAHTQSAKNEFKSKVEVPIDEHLKRNWFPGNPVTVVLDEVYPDTDNRIRAFLVPLTAKKMVIGM